MYHSLPYLPEVKFDQPKEQYVPQCAQAYALAYHARADHPLTWLAAECAWEFHFCQSLNPETNQDTKLTFEQYLKYQKQCWQQLHDCLKRLEQARRQQSIEQRFEQKQTVKQSTVLTEQEPRRNRHEKTTPTVTPAEPQSVTAPKLRMKVPMSEGERLESMGIQLYDCIKPIQCIKPSQQVDWRVRTKDCAFQTMGKLIAPEIEAVPV